MVAPFDSAGHFAPLTSGDATPPPPLAPRLRTLWVSDVHLGTSGCQAEALLAFLRSVRCETLYLVGDIVDGWQLRRKWYWPASHHAVVTQLLAMAASGTRVVFIAGNHDEFARKHVGLVVGGIEVADEAVHTTARGERLWVTHGDHFDGVVQCARWLALLGDRLYEFTLKLNAQLNRWRARMGLPYWSLSQYLKHQVKRAVQYIGDYEQALIDEVRRRGMDGVVCGHIHHAELRESGGIVYANCGDWVESLTAIGEDAQGQLMLMAWPAGANLRPSAALQQTGTPPRVWAPQVRECWPARLANPAP